MSANRTAESLIGTTLEDRYEILSLCGAGGMGVVYRGRHLLMDKIVAIKMLNSAYICEPGAFDRFMREAKIACQLSHPNIVTVHDFGASDDNMYLVMDFVKGKSLGEILDEDSTVPESLLVRLAIDVCDGLEHAHEQGLIHRDLKPGNIMVVTAKDGSQRAKILDFGLARFLDDSNQQKLSQSGYLLGTGFYLSPEQCRGKKADVRSEMYSLGCVLYEALSGVPPLMGENILETCQKQIDGSPRPLHEVRPDIKVSEGMAAIIDRALQKDPDARFQTAAEFRSALLSLQSNQTDGNTVEARATQGADGWGNAASGISNFRKGILVSACIFLTVFAAFRLAGHDSREPAVVPATDPQYSAVFSAGTKALAKDDYASAEKNYQRAVTIARSERRDEDLLASLKELQDVLYVERKLKDADGLNAEIERLQSSPSRAHSNATMLASDSQDSHIAKLAMSCHQKGQCDTAVSLLEHAIDISKQVYGAKSAQTAARMEELAKLYMALDESDKAQPLIEEVMEIKSSLKKK